MDINNGKPILRGGNTMKPITDGYKFKKSKGANSAEKRFGVEHENPFKNRKRQFVGMRMKTIGRKGR